MCSEQSAHNESSFRFRADTLPCVQLAPVRPSAHTSWPACSSPRSGPGCSRARRWGAPWWPAHPHLEVTHYTTLTPRVDCLPRHKTAQRWKVCRRAFYEPAQRGFPPMESVNNVFLFPFPLSSSRMVNLFTTGPCSIKKQSKWWLWT